MDIYYGLGIFGAGLILLAFIFRKNKKYGVSTKPYLWLNLLGSLFLVIYAWEGQVWPFVVLNGVWFIDSLRGIFFTSPK
jgi:hypothetical protein